MSRTTEIKPGGAVTPTEIVSALVPLSSHVLALTKASDAGGNSAGGNGQGGHGGASAGGQGGSSGNGGGNSAKGGDSSLDLKLPTGTRRRRDLSSRYLNKRQLWFLSRRDAAIADPEIFTREADPEPEPEDFEEVFEREAEPEAEADYEIDDIYSRDANSAFDTWFAEVYARDIYPTNYMGMYS